MTHSHDEYSSPFIREIIQKKFKNEDLSTKTKLRKIIDNNWLPVTLSLDYQFKKWFVMLQNILGFIHWFLKREFQQRMTIHYHSKLDFPDAHDVCKIYLTDKSKLSKVKEEIYKEAEFY